MLRPTANLTPGNADAGAELYATASPNTIRDVYGNALTGANTTDLRGDGRATFQVYIFNAIVAAEAIAPLVASSTPTSGATSVPRSIPLTVTFNEAMDPSTPVTGTTFTVTSPPGGAVVPGRVTVSADLRTITFTPTQPLAAGQDHRIALSAGLRDLRNNAFAGATIDFTTRAAGPAALTVTPARGPLEGGETILITGEGFTPYATVTIDGKTCADVAYLSQSQLTCTVPPGTVVGAKDVTVSVPGGGLVGLLFGGYLYDPTTATGGTTPIQGDLRPEVWFEYPPSVDGGTAPFPAGSRFVVVFSEPMDTGATSFNYATSGGTIAVNGTAPALAYGGTLSSMLTDDGRNTILVVDPTDPIAEATARLVLFGNRTASGDGVRDLAGNRLENIHNDITFITGGTDYGMVFDWTRVAADATAPTYLDRRPAPGTTAFATALLRLEFSEEIDPTTTASFRVNDDFGFVPGAIALDLDTMKGFTFDPSRVLIGTVTVDATSIEDLSGNAVGGSTYTFSATAEAAPRISLLTLNDIPSYQNGSAANGGGALGDTGRLRTPPTGFTIDLTYESTSTPTVSLTCDRTVGNQAAGTNLVPFFPPGTIVTTPTSIHLLVPDNLPFPSGVTSTITATLTNTGGTSPARTFTFDCFAPRGDILALDGSPDVWFLRFDRDFDTASYALGSYLSNTTGSDTVTADGVADFDFDLTGYGARSTAGDALVNGSATLTMNQAARNWVTNRTIYHVARLYGQAVSFSDGSLNPGFAGAIDFTPKTGAGGANIRFVYGDATSLASQADSNRMGIGGLAGGFVLGRASMDPQNDVRDHDDGATSATSNLGVFSALTLQLNYDGEPPNPLDLFRQLFDPLTPFSGGTGSFGGATAGTPVGAHAEDPVVLSPTADPAAFTPAQLARQRVVLRALDALALNIAGTTAHEIGHSLGLIDLGSPGAGLYGGLAAFGVAANSQHINLGQFFPGNGQNLMSVSSSFESGQSRFVRLEPLSEAYLRNTIIVEPDDF